MLKIEDMNHLAVLARIVISDEEKTEMLAKFETVLAYVSDVQSVDTTGDDASVAGELRNVMRCDELPNVGGGWTELILANAPGKEDGYVKVKQIM